MNTELDQEQRRRIAETRHRIYTATHTTRDVKTIPDHAHFAVLVNESMSYDDGYGERGSSSYSTHNYIDYITFDSEEALEDWILQNHTKKTYKVVNVKAVTVEMKTLITVRDV